MAAYDASTLVYVAAFPDPRPGHRGAMIETKILADGRPAALAFTSRDGLVAALGQAQPWIAVPLGLLQRWVGSAGVGTVAVDPEVPADTTRWEADDLRSLDAILPAREG